MPDRFTSEEAFEAAEEGEPIMLSLQAAKRICRDHGADWYEFADEHQTDFAQMADACVPAHRLLGWLGY